MSTSDVETLNVGLTMTTQAVSADALAATQRALGPLHVLDLGHLGCVDAHRQLGQDVRPQVWRILDDKLTAPPDRLARQIRLARYSQALVQQKLTVLGDPMIHGALGDFVNCLTAWGQGAGLASFRADRLRGVVVDGQPLSDADLAWWLQDDQGGCQTGVLRDHDGSAVFWHTEEDHSQPGRRLDRLRLFSYSVSANGRPVAVFGFIYPDLLPGSAFGWRTDGYVQGVDSLNLKPMEQQGGLFANVAAWVSLHLGHSLGLAALVGGLGPFADGYAITGVSSSQGVVSAEKVEFSRSLLHAARLPAQPGTFMFQVNMFSDRQAPVAALCEDISPEKRARLAGRLDRANRHLTGFSKQPPAEALVVDLLRSREGADYAFANPDVKANLVARLSGTQMTVSAAAGPSVLGEDRLHFQYAL